ncbi:MAG: hypothetical protein ACLTDR_14480 [Adlercreutzia equolifaciens]
MMYAPGEDVARLTCALRAAPGAHRSITRPGRRRHCRGRRLHLVIEATKDLGLVTQVFDEATLAGLGEGAWWPSGMCAIPRAAGRPPGKRPQPCFISPPSSEHAHRAGPQRRALVNTNHLRAQLIDEGEHLRAGTDSEVAAKAIGHLTRQTHHLREGIRYAMENPRRRLCRVKLLA